jgi:hypothetical protein
MVDWSKQLILFGLAAVFSIYWTGRQGLWDVMGGESSWDKEWKEAKQLLARHIITGSVYEKMRLASKYRPTCFFWQILNY